MRNGTWIGAALAVGLLGLGAGAGRAAEKAEAKQLRLGTLAPEGTPWADLLAKLKDTVEQASKGEVKVKLYLNGRLGDEPDMLKRVGEKKLEGGGFTSTGLAGLVPELALLEVPFLFESDAEADLVMDETLRDEFRKRFEAKGLHLYMWAVNGWVDFGSAGRPITSIEDLRSAHPYTRDARARKAFWEACGAKATVLAVPEVGAALVAGKIDLYDTTPLFATAARWYASTRHWTDSNHIYQPAAVVFDLAWWKALPEDVRKALEAAAPELQGSARRAVRGLDSSLMEEFHRQGVALHALAPAAREAMRAATAGIADAETKEGVYPKELLDKLRAALAAARAKAAGAAPASGAAPAARPDPLAQHIAAADRHVAGRPNVGELNRAEFEISEALRLDPKSYEATWRMARVKAFLGKYGPDAAKLTRFESAMDWAKKAVALDAGRTEGHYWTAVAMGLFGETKGISASLFLVGDMQEALEKAAKIDGRFDGGGPPRVLGRLFFKLPWVAGGSNKKALQYLREAIKLEPQMPFNYTYLAEVLIDEDEEKEAKELLQKLGAMTPDPRWPQEFKEALAEQQRLLKKL